MKYPVSDVPPEYTISGWLYRQTDWAEVGNKCQPRRDYGEGLQLAIEGFDQDALLSSVHQALAMWGDHAWTTSSGIDASYTGFSLTYDPRHQEGLDPHKSSLGTSKVPAHMFEYGAKVNHAQLKHSYYDAYGFTQPTPASQHGALGQFLNRCKSTRVRSRLSCIHGDQYKYRDKFSGWHRDEPVYENLRLNIPIQTSQHFLFQLRDQPGYHLEPGYAYTWDTHKEHRAYNTCRNTDVRIHLILGFSTWWDYDSTSDSWQQNQFYGTKHPFDMLVDGDVFEGLTLVES